MMSHEEWVDSLSEEPASVPRVIRLCHMKSGLIPSQKSLQVYQEVEDDVT